MGGSPEAQQSEDEDEEPRVEEPRGPDAKSSYGIGQAKCGRWSGSQSHPRRRRREGLRPAAGPRQGQDEVKAVKVIHPSSKMTYAPQARALGDSHEI